MIIGGIIIGYNMKRIADSSRVYDDDDEGRLETGHQGELKGEEDEGAMAQDGYFDDEDDDIEEE